jgi:hypothetical protein
MGETKDALRWLGSPVTAGAVAVLALNDHVLKQAWPGPVTGKLSDVAGLVVAPPLVALLLALVRVRRSPLLVTGAVFAVVKTVPAAAAATSACLGWAAGPSYVRADPTDLLALPALLLAHHARRTSTDATSLPRRVRLALGALVLPFAVVATAATSPCYEPRGAYSAEAFRGVWEDGSQRASTRVVVQNEGVTGGVTLVVDEQGQVSRLASGLLGRLAAGGSYLTRDCTGERPPTCWRVRAGSDGWTVTRTTHGVAPTAEYALSRRDVEVLRAGLGESCGKPRIARPDDLAVLDVPEGTVVVVAAGNAGLLVRSPAGTWRRVRETRLPARTYAAATPDRGPTGLLTPRPTPTPAPTPSGPPPLPCASPSLVTVTPDPRNGPPTAYPVCPPSVSP